MFRSSYISIVKMLPKLIVPLLYKVWLVNLKTRTMVGLHVMRFNQSEL